MGTKIIATNLKTGEQRFFESQKEAAMGLRVNSSCISRVLTGEREQAGGWSFSGADKRPKKPVETTGKTLREVLEEYSMNDILSIGAKSAYFFIGDAGELSEYLTDHSELLDREVLSQYERIDPDDGYIIIVEGEEIAKYWLREDYQKEHKKNAA